MLRLTSTALASNTETKMEKREIKITLEVSNEVSVKFLETNEFIE